MHTALRKLFIALSIAAAASACGGPSPVAPTAGSAPSAAGAAGAGGPLNAVVTAATHQGGGVTSAGATNIFGLSNNVPASDPGTVDLAACLAGSSDVQCRSASDSIKAESVSDPAPPTRLSSVVIGNTVTLAWQAPADPIVSYIIEAGSAPGLSDLARISTGNSRVSLFIAGVPPGTYYVRVRAQTILNVSPASNEVVVVVGGSCTPLGAPVLRLVSNVNGFVAFDWTTPAGAPTSYILEAGSAPGAANIANSDLGSAATVFSVSGVPAGTYFVRVRARNSCGVSLPSNEIALTVTRTGPVPGGGRPPTIVQVSFPLTISGQPGASTSGTVDYTDPDADAAHAFFKILSSSIPFSDFDFDISSGGAPNGRFGFRISCVASSTRPCSGSTSIRLTLRDAAGNESQPYDFSFSWVP